MKVSFAALFLPLFAILTLLALRAPAQDNPFLSLDNEFVRVVVNRGPDEAGRFSIRTTGGDPSRPTSRNQHLIFGGNAPWTSYTTLRIDNENYAFGGATNRRAAAGAKFGKLTAEPVLKEGKILTTYMFGDIEAVQELSLARGQSTRMLDTVNITYRLVNKGTVPHEVGVRVMLDTMCGTNDGAPIRMGSQQITKAQYVTGGAVADFWQAFDNLSNPTVVSQGTLRGGETTPPDKVLFADWGSLADEPWEFAPKEDQGFIRLGEVDPDTAAAMFWSPTALAPGHTRVVTTHYGVGGWTGAGGQISLALVGPAETTFEHERTQPFTVTAYIQNDGGFDARDAVVTLTLPDGLELVSGNRLKESYAQVARGAIVQESWTLRATGKAGGSKNLLLAVTTGNIEPNKVTRPIQVNVPSMKLHLLPHAQQVPLKTNNLPTIIPIQLNLMPAEKFYGARVTLRFDPNVVRPFDVSRGRAFVEEGRLLSGWEFDNSRVDEGMITFTGLRTDAPLTTQAELNLAIVKFRTVEPGKCALTLEKTVLITEKGEEKALDVTNGEITVLDQKK